MAKPDSNGFGQDFKNLRNALPNTIDRASEFIHSRLFPRKITTEIWKVPDPDFSSTLKKVEGLIADEWGRVLAMPNDNLNANRYAAISKTIQKVSPPLRLVWWRTLEKQQCTPRSNEGYTLTLEEAAAICKATGKVFTYYFLSHRWESREHPDPTARKARICAEFGKERTRTFNEEVFYWIDYACIDQEGMAPFIASLPLYCSGAQVLMVPFHEEYEERGWCLVERLAYAALGCPLQFVCGKKYIEYAKTMGWKQQQSCFTFFSDNDGRHYSWLRPLADPGQGKLGYERDRPLIKDLTKVLLRQWGKSWQNSSTWPPPGAYLMSSTTGRSSVQWGKTTTNVILMSFI